MEYGVMQGATSLDLRDLCLVNCSLERRANLMQEVKCPS